MVYRVTTRSGDEIIGSLSINFTQCPAVHEQRSAQLQQTQPLSNVGSAVHHAVAAMLPYAAAMPVGPAQVCIIVIYISSLALTNACQSVI